MGTYDRHELVGDRTVLAHNVHATDNELALLAAQGAAIAHCPTSNAALGSGLFPLRGHVSHGVRVALGSDVGAGTGFCLFKEGLQAYFMQQLLGADGLPLTGTHLLHLATRAGALALGMGDTVGDLSVDKQFDAIWVSPSVGDPLEVGLRHAASADDALAKIFALAVPADVAAVWIGGDQVKGPDALPQRAARLWVCRLRRTCRIRRTGTRVTRGKHPRLRPGGSPPDLLSRTDPSTTSSTWRVDWRRLRAVSLNMGPEPSGPDAHFHKTLSESFFVLTGTIRLYDGAHGSMERRVNFYVPEGGLHGFRNESGEPASMLILFAPGGAEGGLLRGPGRDRAHRAPPVRGGDGGVLPAPRHVPGLARADGVHDRVQRVVLEWIARCQRADVLLG